MNAQLPLPTDNFYKFCALAGVTIVVLSVYLPATVSLQIDEEMYKLRLEIAATKVEMEFQQRAVTKSEQTLGNLLSDKTDEQSRAEGKLPVHITTAEFVAEHNSHIQKQKDIEIALQTQTVKISRLEQLLTYLWITGFGGLVGLLIGIRIAIFGFTNWYRKIQLPLDRLSAEVKGHDADA